MLFQADWFTLQVQLEKEEIIILTTFILFHVALSLVGIGGGFVVAYGQLLSKDSTVGRNCFW